MILMTTRNMYSFPISESLISVARSSSTLCAGSCRMTSVKFSEYSAEEVPTRNSRICWLEGARSINGTILNRKRKNARCEAGAILIQSRSPMKTKASTGEERDDALALLRCDRVGKFGSAAY